MLDGLMPRRSPSRRALPSDDRRGAILDIVHRSLATALAGQCARQYDASLLVRRVDDRSHPGRATLCVECRGLVHLSVRLQVRPVDRHVFEVCCSVEDGPRQRFSFSQPPGSGVRLSLAPVMGEKMAEHVISVLTDKLGDRLLQSAAGPPSASVHPRPN